MQGQNQPRLLADRLRARDQVFQRSPPRRTVQRSVVTGRLCRVNRERSKAVRLRRGAGPAVVLQRLIGEPLGLQRQTVPPQYHQPPIRVVGGPHTQPAVHQEGCGAPLASLLEPVAGLIPIILGLHALLHLPADRAVCRLLLPIHGEDVGSRDESAIDELLPALRLMDLTRHIDIHPTLFDDRQRRRRRPDTGEHGCLMAIQRVGHEVVGEIRLRFVVRLQLLQLFRRRLKRIDRLPTVPLPGRHAQPLAVDDIRAQRGYAIAARSEARRQRLKRGRVESLGQHERLGRQTSRVLDLLHQ